MSHFLSRPDHCNIRSLTYSQAQFRTTSAKHHATGKHQPSSKHYQHVPSAPEMFQRELEDPKAKAAHAADVERTRNQAASSQTTPKDPSVKSSSIPAAAPVSQNPSGPPPKKNASAAGTSFDSRGVPIKEPPSTKPPLYWKAPPKNVTESRAGPTPQTMPVPGVAASKDQPIHPPMKEPPTGMRPQVQTIYPSKVAYKDPAGNLREEAARPESQLAGVLSGESAATVAHWADCA